MESSKIQQVLSKILKTEGNSYEQDIHELYSIEEWKGTELDNMTQTDAINLYCQHIEQIGWKLLNEIENEIHDLTQQIELNIQDVDNNVPKLSVDLNLIKYKSEQVNKSIIDLESQLKVQFNKEERNKLEKEKGMVAELSQLHNNKLEIQNEIEMLNQRAFWNNLESEIGSALEQKNFVVASKKYKQGKLSLLNEQQDNKLLNNNDELLNNRTQVLNQCLQRIEAFYRVPLNEAIKNKDKTILKSLLNAYIILNDEDKVYNKLIKEMSNNIIIKFKQKCQNNEEDQLNLLSSYINNIKDMINKELNWCLAIFEEKLHLFISKLIHNFMQTLNEYYFKDIEYNTTNYPLMISSFKISNQFLFDIEMILYNQLLPYTHKLEEEDQILSVEVKDINDFKISHVLLEWAQLISPNLQPFLKFQQHLETYEKQILINKLLLDINQLDLIQSWINQIFLKEGIENIWIQSKQFTFGFNLITILNHIKLIHSHLLSIIKNSFKQIKKQTQSEDMTIDWNYFQHLLKGIELLINFKDHLINFLKLLQSEFNYLNYFINWDLNNMDKLHLENFLQLQLGFSFCGIQSLFQSQLNNSQFNKIINNINSNELNLFELFLLTEVDLSLNKKTEQISYNLLRILLQPIKTKLTNNSNNDTSPITFSLAPSKSITLIGEYLLTLPQRLEAYCDEKSFMIAIKSFNSLEDTLAAWMLEIGLHSMTLFLDNINSIYNSKQQLNIDLNYFINVINSLSIEPNNALFIMKSILHLDHIKLVNLLKELEINQLNSLNFKSNKTYLDFMDLLLHSNEGSRLKSLLGYEEGTGITKLPQDMCMVLDLVKNLN